MKNLLALSLCLSVLAINAQKVIEKNLTYKGQFIELNTAFASDIEVKTWYKPTI